MIIYILIRICGLCARHNPFKNLIYSSSYSKHPQYRSLRFHRLKTLPLVEMSSFIDWDNSGKSSIFAVSTDVMSYSDFFSRYTYVAKCRYSENYKSK